MKILVTGATGFLGRHLLARLSREHEVVGLARNIPLHADTPHVQGDVLDPASLAKAMEGVDVLVHAAGKVSHEPVDAARTWDVHVKGTCNALDAAARAGVRRVIHLSSSGTVAVSHKPAVLDERAPSPLPVISRWPYYRAKLFSEQEALSRSRAGFEVISLNPSLLLGPGDASGEATRPVLIFLQGQLQAAPSGGLSFVDVRDVAEAVSLALTRGRGGQRYLLGAANWSWADFYRRLAALCGMQPPPFTLPKVARKLISWLPEPSPERPGLDLPISRAELDLASAFWYLDDRKAREELGFHSRLPTDTLLDTVRGA